MQKNNLQAGCKHSPPFPFSPSSSPSPHTILSNPLQRWKNFTSKEQTYRYLAPEGKKWDNRHILNPGQTCAKQKGTKNVKILYQNSQCKSTQDVETK